MKTAILTAIRFLAVALVYFVDFVVVSGALLSTTQQQPAPVEAAKTLLALLTVSLISVAVWTYVVRRSRWSGWKLMLTVFFVFYGVNTLLPQIETAYFVTGLPQGMLSRLFIAGLIMAAVFSPLAVLILGKARARATDTSARLVMPVNAWIVKLSLIAFAYVVIYFTFGYFIAWKSEAVRAFYGGNDPGSFITHIFSLIRTEPLLFVLQIARGLLWAAIAVPVVKMMKGEWWEAGLAVALLFAMTSALLLIPNPLMPPAVRMAHLLETSTSNFLFGWLVVLVFRGARAKTEREQDGRDKRPVAVVHP
jgi:hypothetical protein